MFDLISYEEQNITCARTEISRFFFLFFVNRISPLYYTWIVYFLPFKTSLTTRSAQSFISNIMKITKPNLPRRNNSVLYFAETLKTSSSLEDFQRSSFFINSISFCSSCSFIQVVSRTMMTFLTSVITTSFVIIYWQVRDTLSSVTECQGATYSIQNRILADHAFTTKPSATIEVCVILCGEHPDCESINYFRKTKTCELNNMSLMSSPEHMVAFESAMYMTNAFRVPCYYDNECERQEEVCLLVVGGSKCEGNVNIFFKTIPFHLGISYTYDISRANRYLIWKIISIYFDNNVDAVVFVIVIVFGAIFCN